MAIARVNRRITPVCQETSIPDSEPARLRQADKGHISPTAGGRRATPMASRYPLRNTQARSYRRERAVGPSMRLATSHTRATATDTGTRSDAPRERRNGVGDRDAGSLYAVRAEM